MNEFSVTDLTQVSAATLAGFDIAILAEMPLTSAEVTMFTTWVNGGGKLIAMRPDKKLAGLLGLTDNAATLADTYFLIDTASGPGSGLVSETIQFHGVADRYTASTASTLATLYSSATTATSSPAMTLRSVGASGGQAAAFAFDVARSIVYTRQGNPAWAGQERDGIAPIRSDDLFFGNAAADPRPDYVDFNKIQIPQADELQRLLANLVIQMNLSKKPLPRFWYLPRGLKAAVVMTGDDHRTGGTASRFDGYIASSVPGCSVADWECVRATAYIMVDDPLTQAQASAYVAQGFEVAEHVGIGTPQGVCTNYTPSLVDSMIGLRLAEFAAAYPSLPPPQTNRTHCVTWSDWASQAKAERNHGIRLDTTYYWWPNTWIGTKWSALFTGSGMPQRFADIDGTLIDVYQAATQMTDESSQGYPTTSNDLLDNAIGPLGYYGVFTANMHLDFSGAAIEGDAIIASARARQVPVVSAKQMLDWLDGRNNSAFGNLAWNAGVLSFTITPAAGSNGLQAMVPANASSGPLTGIFRNGSSISFTLDTVKGISYALFPASSGSYQVSYQAAPATTVSINDASISEGNSGTKTLTFSASLSSSRSVPVSVTYSTSDGTASAGTDYVGSSGTLTFAPGTTQQPVNVIVNGDTLNEADETFFVNLSNPINATIGLAPGVGTILNDDPLPALSINDVSLNEGNSGTTNFVFTVTLAPASGQAVTVAYATANVTATAGSDYVAQSGTLTIPVGATSSTITVLVNGDVRNEPDETFTLTLSSPVNATITRAQGIGTIVNDDDSIPPTVIAVKPSSGAVDVPLDTIVTVQFSEAMDPTTINASTIRLTATGASSDVPGTVSLSGVTATITPTALLTGNTLYQVTVSGAVTDLAANPLGANTGATFMTTTAPFGLFTDTTTADFSAGTPDASTAVTQTADGEVSLMPTLGSEFNGTALPAGWSSVAWNTGGTATVGGGALTVNGARAFGTTLYAAARSLEFVATFSATANAQHVGLGVDLSTAPWAIFSTGGGGGLYARSNNGSIATDTLLTGNWLGTPHRFRIDWTSSSVVFSVDGTTVASHPVAITATMRPIASDLTVGGPAVSVDWLRLTPFAAAGTFLSRVIDSNAQATWSTFGWVSDLPGGTGLALAVRLGNTPTPDASWTPFTAVASPGAPIGGSSRYLQYRATLTTSVPAQTPQLQSVRIGAKLGSTLSISDVAVNEGDVGLTTATFTVTLTPSAPQTVTVDYATADGTAAAGSDYVAKSGTLTFPTGTTTQTITVSVNGDILNEADESFVVNLSAPTNATFAKSQGVGTIRNDDPLPALAISAGSATEGNAGTTPAVFTVTLTPVSGQTVTVGYATADGTATAGSDYVAQSGTLTFAPGVTTRTVSVLVNGDVLNEADETFGVTLSTPVNATISKAQGVGTIVNDDPLPALAIANATVTEGNTGTSNAVFTVTLTPVSGQTVTVAYATADGTATAGSDYTAQGGTLTFAPGVTTRTIAVAVTGDTTYEPDETFGVTLSSPTAATVTTAQATGTILNDDPLPTIAIADLSVAEGNTGTTSFGFAVTLSNGNAQPITVNYATSDGTAQAGSDYQAQSGTLTFAPGVTTQSVTVLVNGDTLNEANETFLVTLSSPTNATIARAQAVGTILNDDAVPALSIADVALAEGTGGTTSFAFTVTLSAVSGQSVTVQYATADGAAIAPGDYTAQSGTLTFAPGITSQQVTILVTGDALNELDETFVVGLSSPTNATISKAQATGTILNDDPLPTLSVNSVSLNEGQSGTTNFVFNVSLSTASGRTVTVNYGTADGSATAPSDYTAKSGVLTFTPGTTLQTITVAVNGDLFVEPNETFVVTLSAPTNATLATAQGTATILNDDAPPTITSRSPAPTAVEVFTDTTVTVGFSQPMNASTFTAARVALRAAGAASDVLAAISFTTSSVTLTPSSLLAAGTTYTMTVAGTVTDAAGNPLGANSSWSFTTTASPLTIFGDVTTADFSAGTPDSNTTVAQLGDGDVVLRGTEGSDFSGTALPAGWSSATWGTGGTAIVGGGVLTVNGARAFGNTLYPAGRAVEFVATFDPTANAQHVGLGVDFNNAPWAIFSTFTGGGLYARTTNGTSTTNTLIAGSWLGAPHRFRIDWTSTTVVYAIDGTQVASHAIAITALMRPIVSDFAVGGPAVTVDWLRMPPYAPAGTFTSRVIDGGSVMSWGNVTWTAVLPAGTSLQVSVRKGNTPTPDASWTAWAPAAGSGSPVGGQSRYLQYQASLATTDQSVTPVLQDIHFDAFLGASLTIGDVSVNEGDIGTVDAIFTVTLAGVVSQPVSVNYATSDGTATVADGDYIAASGVLTFAIGSTSQQIIVKVKGDTLNEPDQTLFVNLSNAVSATISRAQGVGTIRNDDPLPALSVSDMTVTEGNAGTTPVVFTVTLTPVSGQTVTVGYATADGTATAGSDYVAQSGTLTFAPGVTTRTVSVLVNGDALNEADETFGVTLSTPVNATITKAQGTGTIVNDDPLPALSIGDVTVNEGQTGTTPAAFTVTLTPVSGQTVTVAYATADGTATAGSDYTAQSGTLTFAPGVTTRTITVAVTGDTTYEPDETFGVTLSSPTAATVTTARATGTIRNDDGVPAITIADVSVSEGNTGTTSFGFAVTLSNASAQPITVSYATSDGTALAGSDYQAQSGTVTFAPGVTTQSVTVLVNGDTVNEPNETFLVTLSSPTNATIARAQAVGTILNDDGVPALSITDVALAEGNTGTTAFAFTVTLSAVSGQSVTVQYATADGTATAPSDYTAQSGTVTFAPGTTSQPVTVAVNGDTIVELNETFTVTLSQAINATIAKAQGTGTIVNDDIDTTPPTITSRSPTAGAIGVGLGGSVSVNFSEPMNPATFTSSTFRLRAQGATSDVPAVVSYTGVTATLTPSAPLTGGTVYQVTMSGSVTDLGGNPLGADATSSFTTITASLSFADTLVSDFTAGVTGASTIVGQIGDGDVLLKPAEGSDFIGTTLPAGWSSSPWGAGGVATVGGGQITIDGARAFANTLYGNNRTLEFVATFSTTSGSQHVGFGVDFNDPPWAIFSTLNGGVLYARTANGTTTTNTLIAGNWLGVPHRFRIDWNATSVVYFIDGTQVVSHPIAITASMRPMASDFTAGGPTVAVDWLRMTPYAAAGSFLSRVFDAGSPATWGTASWVADLPAGTTLTLSVSRGATPLPDASWTPFAQIPASGSAIGGNARYLQYRIDLSTTDVRQTPVVRSVGITATIP